LRPYCLGPGSRPHEKVVHSKVVLLIIASNSAWTLSCVVREVSGHRLNQPAIKPVELATLLNELTRALRQAGSSRIRARARRLP